MNFEAELHKLIALRAHELSQQSNNGEGGAFDNWLRAEQEIRQELDFRSEELFRKISLPADEF